jgi:hypothetical protein
LNIAQHLPPNWSTVILDKDWVIVARGSNPEKFVGQKGAGEEFRIHAHSGHRRTFLKRVVTANRGQSAAQQRHDDEAPCATYVGDLDDPAGVPNPLLRAGSHLCHCMNCGR